MATITLRCPHCQASLRLASPPAPGKKLRCPKCGDVFAVDDAEPAPVVQAVQPKRRPPTPAPPARQPIRAEDEEDDAPRRRRRYEDDEDEEDEPDRRTRRRKRTKQGSSGLLI